MIKLTRYYSLTSLVGIAIVVVVLSFVYRDIAVSTLKDNETKSNVNLTRVFSNSIWQKYSNYVNESAALSGEEILANPKHGELYNEVYDMMKGISVVKVKIYALNGKTIFSTDPTQVGEIKSDSKGFLTAKNGNVVSEITFRNEFYSLEGIISKRNIVSSYLPIFELDLENGEKISGVFELYSDVTPLLENIGKTHRKIVLIVLSVLIVLYLFLFAIVKHADRIIKKNESVRHENEEKIRYHAYHDNLTGLKNRVSFIEYMENLLLNSGQKHESFGLIYMDVDRFKVVNDSLGHNTGDELIEIVSRRIEGALKEGDSLFRWGGDEFVLVVKNLQKQEDVAVVAKRILDIMDRPITLKEYKIYVNVSMGISIYPRDGNNTESLIKYADAAMYQVKNSGGNNFSYYTESVNIQALNRLELESGLQNAIRKQEFFLEYQPKISVDDNALVGVEALLRWQHPEKGVIPPDKFIYLLEETGLINQVGEWVLLTACRQLKNWNDGFHPNLRMSVNISTNQFKSGLLVDTVRRIIKKTGINPVNLDLELTETLLIDNIETAIQTMYQLKSLGVTISIDDFGSGYSSLNYLKQFPIDQLKIDKTFISELDIDEKDAAITTAITVLAKNLSLGVVAEGVETKEQLDFIKETGCEQAQGFYFCGPVSPGEIESMFEELPSEFPSNVIKVTRR